MKCACGKTISENKPACRDCVERVAASHADAPAFEGVLEILNVQGGDVKITFDKENIQETIRARRIVTDMLRRGYAIVVEVERGGERKYERIQDFDEKTGEYIIADFDSLGAARVDAEQEIPDAVVNELSRPDALPRLAGAAEDNKLCKCGRPLKHRGSCKGVSHKEARARRLPMERTKATGIGRSAGG